jgi:hypothetical protein
MKKIKSLLTHQSSGEYKNKQIAHQDIEEEYQIRIRKQQKQTTKQRKQQNNDSSAQQKQVQRPRTRVMSQN